MTSLIIQHWQYKKNVACCRESMDCNSWGIAMSNKDINYQVRRHHIDIVLLAIDCLLSTLELIMYRSTIRSGSWPWPWPWPSSDAIPKRQACDSVLKATSIAFISSNGSVIKSSSSATDLSVSCFIKRSVLTQLILDVKFWALIL